MLPGILATRCLVYDTIGKRRRGHKVHQWTTGITSPPLKCLTVYVLYSRCVLAGVSKAYKRWRKHARVICIHEHMHKSKVCVPTHKTMQTLTVGAVGNSVSGNRTRCCVKTEDEQHYCIVSLPTWTGAICLSNTCYALTVNLACTSRQTGLPSRRTAEMIKKCIAKFTWNATNIKLLPLIEMW